MVRNCCFNPLKEENLLHLSADDEQQTLCRVQLQVPVTQHLAQQLQQTPVVIGDVGDVHPVHKASQRRQHRLTHQHCLLSVLKYSNKCTVKMFFKITARAAITQVTCIQNRACEGNVH